MAFKWQSQTTNPDNVAPKPALLLPVSYFPPTMFHAFYSHCLLLSSINASGSCVLVFHLLVSLPTCLQKLRMCLTHLCLSRTQPGVSIQQTLNKSTHRKTLEQHWKDGDKATNLGLIKTQQDKKFLNMNFNGASFNFVFQIQPVPGNVHFPGPVWYQKRCTSELGQLDRIANQFIGFT